MKLLIQTELIGTETYYSNFQEYDWWLDELKDFEDWLKEFTVDFKSTVTSNSYSITIESQKVTLDEIQMNELVFELNQCFENLKIVYAGLGGAGTDFSIRMTQETE